VRRHTEGLEQEVTRRTKDLVESQERYKILFDEAADSVLMVNPGGGIVAVNRRQETVLKYPEEQLVGRRFLDLILPKDQPAVSALMTEIVGGARKTPTVEVKVFDRAGRPVPMELDLTSIHTGAMMFLMVQLRDITERKHLERQVQEYSEALELITGAGELRTALVSVSPLHDNNGAIMGVLGIARDITEKKQLEQQVLNAEKLASIGKLSAGVAHEINNPLGGILNCLYNLRKGGLSPDRQGEYLVSMEDGLRRVQKIVRQLLDFSQQHD